MTRIGFVREDLCDPWQVFRRIKLDFQVNGETYFLSLAEDDRRWQVFVSTPTGPRSVPVYEDAEESEDVRIVIEDKDRRQIVN